MIRSSCARRVVLPPTPRALAIAPGLKQWLNDAGALVAGPAFEPVSARWTTAIAANDYIQSALIVPFLTRLRAQRGRTRVAVRPAQTDRVAETLANGELDLNITGTTETPSYDLHSRVLYEERYVGVVRKDHPLKGQHASVARRLLQLPTRAGVADRGAVCRSHRSSARAFWAGSDTSRCRCRAFWSCQTSCRPVT